MLGFANFTTQTMSSPPPFQRTATPFTPCKHSPLTPQRSQSPSTADQSFSPLSPQESPVSLLKFAEIKRKHKPNPLLTNSEGLREKRRNLFLKKLADAREQSRIQARGGEDEMMRMILVSEQRRWYASLAKAAAKIPTIEEETEIQLLRDEDNLSRIDDLLNERDQELEAILSQLEIRDHAQDTHEQAGHVQPVTTCGVCREQDSIVDVQGEQVCFCCGWLAT
ncbi:hypothetical protein BDZ91DRAFT_711925 [Kalaharituber pfeilii]|nr:hypothetical protein BDZ91DRAFT_711925 [Kalaharituber pfeilii]